MLTYGDGVADVDIAKLLEFHRAHGKLATIMTDPGACYRRSHPCGEGWIIANEQAAPAGPGIQTGTAREQKAAVSAT
jgi:hypothetical protein